MTTRLRQSKYFRTIFERRIGYALRIRDGCSIDCVLEIDIGERSVICLALLRLNRPRIAAAYDPWSHPLQCANFVPAVGAAIAHRTVARDYEMTGTIADPGAGIGLHAFPGAGLARPR